MPKSILRDHRAAERAVQADAQDVVEEARIHICTDEAARREREGPGTEAVEIHIEHSHNPAIEDFLLFTISYARAFRSRNSENIHPLPNSRRIKTPYTKAPAAISSSNVVSSRNVCICAK